MEHTGFEPKAQILLQPNAKVGFPLRCIQLVVRAHLGLIIRAGADLDRTAITQLTVRRRSVLLGGELWLDAQCIGITPFSGKR